MSPSHRIAGLVEPIWSRVGYFIFQPKVRVTLNSFPSRFPSRLGDSLHPPPQDHPATRNSPSSSSPWTPGCHPSGCRRGAQLPSEAGCVRWSWFSGGSSWQSWPSLLSEEQQRHLSEHNLTPLRNENLAKQGEKELSLHSPETCIPKVWGA